MVQLIKTLVKLPPNKNFSLLEILELTILILLILYFGKTLFIPLSFAILISFILYPICKWLEKIGVNKVISIFLALSIVFLILGAIVYLLFFQVSGFLDEWSTFKIKFSESLIQLTSYLNEQFGIQNIVLSDLPKKLINSSGTPLRLENKYSHQYSYLYLDLI